jgi:gliding motility-associated-like protein
MRIKYLFIIIVLLMAYNISASGQTDTVPPVSPVLDLVTVDQLTGYSELSWTPSPSPDVSEYIVYSFTNNAGYSIDTIHNPFISSYIHTSLISSELSQSYVVAALDNAGNISPLSNALNTIFTSVNLDTCDRKIEIKWNGYPSYPRQVQAYTVLFSVDGSSYTTAGTTGRDENMLILNDFLFDSQYCFIVRADLQGGSVSLSNKVCLYTRMQRPPQWINADYATVVPEDEILMSFKADPLSEIRDYILERKTGSSGIFSQIYHFTDHSDSFLYTDGKADISKINYYRLSAVNNCNVPITVSNIASNIVLSVDQDENDINLTWNPYKEWNGAISSYKLFIKTDKQFEERYSLEPADTAFNIKYSDLMYETTGYEVCFIIIAYEKSNPYGVSGESRSSRICSNVTEIITVPNVFTPDNNLVNDLFVPVLSFTPVDYHLVITDLRRKMVFETRDHTEKWDGTKNGDPVPEGAYLWFLEVKVPSGGAVSRTGTLTVIRTSR